ncbi:MULTISPECIES: GntR family transcriptional regulator [Paenarthrobacter]|uniref:GntR family transcriptional regulator n=1 Tax=Paenarthrobacter TaxID=1742992 RepID=UPI002230C828|nr:GntR family transcriptional regulator [Paenarthrobacter sp. PAE-2]MCW3767350.1 GntR family transcriptional regulator [Paenarthrobacter sp. PAE-2]
MSTIRNTAPTAPETAYLWLRREISLLPWDEEAFLTENAIAKASGVSRTPVREALLRLEAAGLIRRVPHKGAYVPALTAHDIESMMEVRRVIEDWAVRKISASGRLGNELDRLLQDQQDSLADPVAFIDVDISFHKHIVHAAGNRALEEVYDSQRIKQQRMGVKAVQDSQGRSDHVVDEHRAIVEAIMQRDASTAAAAVLNHLESTLAVLKAIPAHAVRG